MKAVSLIERLSAVHPAGFDLSLDRIARLLSALGDPHLSVPPVIHVAGTNGKGSVVAFCRAMLEAAGHGVHVHTSPHLVNWHERFRLAAPGGGRLVDDDTLAHAIDRVVAANGDAPSTVFEILTAAMFVLFSEHEADYSLIEVGLGGRFDATNVVPDPLISVITPIALDHAEYLGDRVELIATEKAGIIKPGRPVVIGPQVDSVLAVLSEIALDRASPVYVAGQDFTFYEQAGRFVYQDENGLADLPLPRLRGNHQIANAATAIAALHFGGVGIAESALERAMDSVYWPGRLERLRPGALYEDMPPGVEIWIDGGHNPSAGTVIAEALADLEDRASMPVFLVAGMLTTKNPADYFAHFAGIAERVFTVPVPGSLAGFAPRDLAGRAVGAGLPASACLSVRDALSGITGLIDTGEPARILICGSLYLIGDVLRQNGTAPT